MTSIRRGGKHFMSDTNERSTGQQGSSSLVDETVSSSKRHAELKPLLKQLMANDEQSPP